MSDAQAQRNVATPTSASLATYPGSASRSHPPRHTAIANAVLAELDERDPDGTLLSGSTDLHQAAQLIVDLVLDPSLTWAQHLGAFYDTDAVRSLLARDGNPVSRQAVNQREGLLALTTGSGRVVYPAFQFQGRQPAHGLNLVLKELPESLVSRWTLASWLITAKHDLDDETPIDVLRDERAGGVDDVVLAAQNWAAQLAS
jgi:hypothetical protein